MELFLDLIIAVHLPKSNFENKIRYEKMGDMLYRSLTEKECAQRICWSGTIKRSNGGRGLWGYSQMKNRVSGWSLPWLLKQTKNGWLDNTWKWIKKMRCQKLLLTVWQLVKTCYQGVLYFISLVAENTKTMKYILESEFTELLGLDYK